MFFVVALVLLLVFCCYCGWYKVVELTCHVLGMPYITLHIFLFLYCCFLCCIDDIAN